MMRSDPPPAPEPADTLVAPAGKFRIYLGAAAGVGKTCAMLDEGARRRQRGRDVVVGFAETHGRPQTAERLRDLEVVPRRLVRYRGSTFEEMDLDAVLARSPQLALVDELAHTNVPGSGRNAKRWEDVVELLAQGINVISTVNIQHLESLADSVERMTGTRVRERVPDAVVRRADQTELIDSSPEQLRRRMVHGNIYPQAQVPQALTSFFSTHNLAVLRDLALRFVADETEELLLHDPAAPATGMETCEHVVVGVPADPLAAHLLRRAARFAARTKCDVHAVHVVTDAARRDDGGGALGDLRRLAEDLGAGWRLVHGDGVAAALVDEALAQHATQLVVGAGRQAGWPPGRGGLTRQIVRAATAAGIDVHVIAPPS
ncbi:MAG TPA: sensor histidine kinase KdpD [Candidatus Micrarchaeia archaeon]|nr:sensor histidine kinase KdpD [Candidatus Micrarchaeia archaeon]